MMLEQIALAILGTSAAWLSQDARPRVARFACLFGLVAQPFWFMVEIAASNWPVVWLCCVYSAGWIRGLLNFWIRPWQARRRVARVWRPRPSLYGYRGLRDLATVEISEPEILSAADAADVKAFIAASEQAYRAGKWDRDVGP